MYRAYIQTREYPKQWTAYQFTVWHEVLREAGEELVVHGNLDAVDDVWFLRKNELFDALAGERIDVDIASRRAEFDRHAKMTAPAVVTSEEEVPNPNVERDGVPAGALGAREYGLPAVVSVPNATRRIRSGQRIHVDGADGIVELLE